MVRKKTALSLDARYVTMIENAYYTVSPPDTQVSVRKVRPPLHQFIRKLLYTDLNKSNCDKVLKVLQPVKLDSYLFSLCTCFYKPVSPYHDDTNYDFNFQHCSCSLNNVHVI